MKHKIIPLVVVKTLNPYLSEIRVVRLIFLGHEEQQDPVEELETIEGGHTHVQEHSVQHRHGNLNKIIALYFACTSVCL